MVMDRGGEKISNNAPMVHNPREMRRVTQWLMAPWLENTPYVPGSLRDGILLK